MSYTIATQQYKIPQFPMFPFYTHNAILKRLYWIVFPLRVNVFPWLDSDIVIYYTMNLWCFGRDTLNVCKCTFLHMNTNNICVVARGCNSTCVGIAFPLALDINPIRHFTKLMTRRWICGTDLVLASSRSLCMSLGSWNIVVIQMRS